MAHRHRTTLSTLDYHVLLAMADGPRYGYAVKTAVEDESSGTLQPRAGTLYRVIARLITQGLAEESAPIEADEPHPGRARKYYGLTTEGRLVLAEEARRLRGAAALADERLERAEGRS